MAKKQTTQPKAAKKKPAAGGMGRREMQDTSRRILAVAFSALALALLAAVLVFVIGWGYRFGQGLFTDRAAGSDRTIVLVKVDEGTSARTLASELKNRGVIDDTLLFVVKGKLYDYEPKAGVYQVNAAMTDRQIWERLSGK